MVNVLVIGAGIAGLMAALRLKENGVNNVVFLEARDRVGGRIYPIDSPYSNGTFQLGAYYIHNAGPGNPLYDYCMKKGLLTSDTYIDYGDDNSAAAVQELNVYTKGHKKLNTDVVLEASKIYEGFFRKYWTTVIDKESKPSLGQLFDQEVEDKLPKNMSCSFTHDLRTTLSGCKQMYAQYTAGDMNTVNAKLFFDFGNEDDDEDDEGEQKTGDVVAPFGLLDTILEDLGNPGEGTMKFNHIVKKVIINPDTDGVSVIVEDATSGNSSTFEADHVICTLPLGVLRSVHQEMFEPPLPELKVKAIEGLEPGTMSKYYVSWSADWRNCTEDENPIDLKYDFLFALPEREQKEFADDWKTGIVLLTILEPEVEDELLVFCWISGEHAKVADSLTDEEVIQGIGEKLREFVWKGIPNPTHLVRNSWTLDPFTLGAYSYPGLKAEPGMVSQLAAPLPSRKNPRILFAGEAASKNWSVLDGALVSGQQAADIILEYNKII